MLALYVQTVCFWLLASTPISGFSIVANQAGHGLAKHSKLSSPLFIYAPPGSGYARPEDEQSEMPDTYEPMMEYPGTMRPGRTPENMPFHDLPIGDDDPEPIPWPHFQQIEWHHRWDPAHPYPETMDQFIEKLGKWATPEMEAETRALNRRDSRRLQDEKEEKKRSTLIVDDEDDHDEAAPDALGDGIFAHLTAAAQGPPPATQPATQDDQPKEEDNIQADSASKTETDDETDFLLDLGLDILDNDDAEEEDSENDDFKVSKMPDSTSAPKTEPDSPKDSSVADVESVENKEPDVSSAVTRQDDSYQDTTPPSEADDLSQNGMNFVPMDEYSGDENDETNEYFDDGGFDYNDASYDDGDTW